MPLPEHLEHLARDCEITPFKSSGPGGQKKNKTESSVRVRHLPSGIVRIGTESRSQGRNRVLALERVWEELQRRARKRKPRKPTAPTRAAMERRLAEKRRRKETKKARGTLPEE
jgi:ribosome-associated protein